MIQSLCSAWTLLQTCWGGVGGWVLWGRRQGFCIRWDGANRQIGSLLNVSSLRFHAGWIYRECIGMCLGLLWGQYHRVQSCETQMINPIYSYKKWICVMILKVEALGFIVAFTWEKSFPAFMFIRSFITIQLFFLMLYLLVVIRLFMHSLVYGFNVIFGWHMIKISLISHC